MCVRERDLVCLCVLCVCLLCVWLRKHMRGCVRVGVFEREQERGRERLGTCVRFGCLCVVCDCDCL